MSDRDQSPLTPEQQALVESWILLAYKLAFKHYRRQTGQRRTLDLLEELQAEALLSLCHAARIFDPGRGYAFSSLAYICIRNRLGLNAYYARRQRRLRRDPLFVDDLPAADEREPLFVLRDQIEALCRACTPSQQRLIRDLLACDGNMSECCRRRGVTSSAVQDQVRRLRERLAKRGKGIA